jgi:hypothetical protein
MHPEIFKEYFTFHCPKTPERLNVAIEKYPQKIEDIKLISNILPTIIKEVLENFIQSFGTELDLQFHLLVGGYGSNAFVEKKIIGDIYFAVEKLSSDPNHLRVIVAHEIGHVYHNALSDKEGIDWKTINWENGLLSLYREGIATYLSQKIVPGLDESIYYSYDDEGKSWLEFYQNNIDNVKKSFLRDILSKWQFDHEKEWFRLSGGRHFGFNRLGYFLGTSFVHHLVQKVGELNAITYWCSNDLNGSVMDWLENLKINKDLH